MMWQNRARFAVAFLGSFVLAAGLAFSQDTAGTGDDTEPPKSQAKTIFDKEIRERLNLTDQQVKDIRKLLADLNRALRIAQAKLILIGYEIEDLIKAEADLATIKAKFEEQAKIRADARYADISTSRAINAVLSESQLAEWQRIKEEARVKSESEKSTGKPK